MPLLSKLFNKWTGYDRVLKMLGENPPDAHSFMLRTLEEFSIRSEVFEAPTQPVHATVFVSTHHSGLMDLLAVYATLAEKAPRLKVVVNRQVLRLEILRPMLIGVHPISSGLRNDAAVAEISDHLASGGNILIFPAGRVGQWRAGGVTDDPWRLRCADVIAQRAQQVIPIYVDAMNGRSFYLIRRLFPKLSVLYFLRAVAKRRKKLVRAVFGEPICTSSFAGLSRQEVMSFLRAKTYQLKNGVSDGNPGNRTARREDGGTLATLAFDAAGSGNQKNSLEWR